MSSLTCINDIIVEIAAFCVKISVSISGCQIVLRYLPATRRICPLEMSGRLKNVNCHLRHQLRSLILTGTCRREFCHLSCNDPRSCAVSCFQLTVRPRASHKSLLMSFRSSKSIHESMDKACIGRCGCHHVLNDLKLFDGLFRQCMLCR
jgi:hypothetical protein